MAAVFDSTITPGALALIAGRPGKWVAQSQGFGGGWRCVRTDAQGRQHGCFADPSEMTLLDLPSYAVGERVRVGVRAGAIEALSDDGALVLLEPSRRDLQGQGFLMRPSAQVTVPLWQLNAENKSQ